MSQLPSSKAGEQIYCDDITTLETDRGYTIWRPVKQNT